MSGIEIPDENEIRASGNRGDQDREAEKEVETREKDKLAAEATQRQIQTAAVREEEKAKGGVKAEGIPVAVHHLILAVQVNQPHLKHKIREKGRKREKRKRKNTRKRKARTQRDHLVQSNCQSS